MYYGGFSQYAKVDSNFLIKNPKDIDSEKSMMLGTAGFTALQCSFAIKAREELLLGEKVNDVLVTGATGGVGSIAVMILSKMGYNVHAVTGKKDKNDYLKDLGAKNIIDRKEFEGESKLLEKGTWDGVVDTVGGSPLTKILAQVKPNGIVASCGNAGGIKINTTVMPFIIRGVKLWGIDSSGASIRRREFLWNEAVKIIDFNKLKSFTKSLSFSELLDTYPKLLEGKFFGRAIVNPNK
jgi:NADPH:quinone reductase and related Zn-dependent oxidoreductases